MSIVTGFVESRVERPSQYKWPDGKPKPSMWSMRVDGTNYGCKNTKPPEEGSYVRFEATQDGNYWNADGSTIQKIEVPTAPVAMTYAQALSAPVSAPTAGAKVADPRQDSIIYQSSRKDAMELIKALLDKDLIDFGKAKLAQKIELVEVYLDHYTVRFMEDVKRLAPPEHESPVNATAPEEATAIARPPRKARVVQEEFPDDGDIPF